MKFVCTYTDGKVGVGQELAGYLAENGEDFVFLEHPIVPGTGRVSQLSTYRVGKLENQVSIGAPGRGAMRHYVRCFATTFLEMRRRRRDTDLFVGHANVDCIAARLAGGRRLKIVYVSIDYMPRRFPGSLLNTVFALADRLAYRWADQIWHSYPDVLRLKPYAKKEKCLDTFHGNNFRRIARKPLTERNRFGLVYLGGLAPAAHLEEAMRSVADLKASYPGVSLDIIGASPDADYMERLKLLAGELGVAERVHWHGLIEKSEDFERIMTGLGVALCLYEMTPERPSWYQLPGKVFAYAACGLPTIVLDSGGPVAVEWTRANNIGIVTELGRLSATVEALFCDEARHSALADSAVEWASRYDWHAKFRRYLGTVNKCA